MRSKATDLRDILVVVLCASSFFISAAMAGPLRPGSLDPDELGWFYNRPGATNAQLSSDRAECASFGLTMGTPLRAGFGSGLIANAMSEGKPVSYTDDCMISKGYRRFNVLGTTLSALTQRMTNLPTSELELYAGAVTPPEGVLAREWMNSYWLPNSTETPEYSPRDSFSPRAYSVTEVGELGMVRLIRPSRPTEMENLQQEAVVAMRLSSVSGQRVRVQFGRVNSSDGTYDRSEVAGQRGWRIFSVDLRPNRSGGGAVPFAAALPPGAYALLGIIADNSSSSFCLGTIIFEIAAGDAVDLGDFTVASAQAVSPTVLPPTARFRIDQPEIDDARRGLVPSSFSSRLRRAEYLNRFPLKCGALSTIYGFDLPGAREWARPSP